MNWILVGLGNPDAEYEGTRHSVGRDFLRSVAKNVGVAEFRLDKKTRALIAKGELFGKKATLVLPETFMNESGSAVKSMVGSVKHAEKLAVLHDDLDLPIGMVKVSFGAGAGGHKGVESVQKVLKTKDFVRIRIGVSPTTVGGKLRKPESEKVVDFVLGKFRNTEVEQTKLKTARKLAERAIELLLTAGKQAAMMEVNTAR